MDEYLLKAEVLNKTIITKVYLIVLKAQNGIERFLQYDDNKYQKFKNWYDEYFYHMLFFEKLYKIGEYNFLFEDVDNKYKVFHGGKANSSFYRNVMIKELEFKGAWEDSLCGGDTEFIYSLFENFVEYMEDFLEVYQEAIVDIDKLNLYRELESKS